MSFNTHHKSRKNVDPLFLELPDSIIDVGFFLQQMLSKKQQGNVLTFIEVEALFFRPAFIAFHILEIRRSIRMIQAHVRHIYNRTNRHRLIIIFFENKAEHISDILSGRLHPVGVNK